MSVKTVFETLNRIEETPSRLVKYSLVDNLSVKDKEILKQIVLMTYDPMRTYRLTLKQPLGPTEPGGSPEESNWFIFCDVLLHLSTRKLELAVGKGYLQQLLNVSTPFYRKYYVRIVNRDLKIGLQDFTKWFPGLIPDEPLMLCESWYEGATDKGLWIAEPKYDGYRCALIIDENSNCEALSRGFKSFWNWEHVAEEVKRLKLKSVVLDGEFYAGSFGMTSSITKTQSEHPERLKLKYNMFDLLTLEEWKTTNCIRPLIDRKASLQGLMSEVILTTPYRHIQSTDNLSSIANEFYNLGFEGTVLKELNSPYLWERSPWWLKIKPEETADVTIVGAELGDADRRHSDKLGRFLIEGDVTYKNRTYHVKCAVGGKLSDRERTEFWAMHQRGELVGKVIEVLYQDVLETISNTYPSLRFPRFNRMRLDKTPLDKGGI